MEFDSLGFDLSIKYTSAELAEVARVGSRF